MIGTLKNSWKFEHQGVAPDDLMLTRRMKRSEAQLAETAVAME
jgi:hypothetical protein